MTQPPEEHRWQEIEELLDHDRRDEVLDTLAAMQIHQGALAILRLPRDKQHQLLDLLEPPQAAILLEAMPEEAAADILREAPIERAAEILNEVHSDETADLLERIDEDWVRLVLDAMQPRAARQARLLSNYESNQAGGRMITECLSYPEKFTAQQVVDDLRANADKYRDFDVQYSYVVDRAKRLRGVLPLRDLLLASGNRRLDSIMIPNPARLTDTASLEEMHEAFREHDFIGLPVVSAKDRLLGVVRQRDLREAESDRNQDMYLKSQGVVGEELRSMPLLRRSGRRLSWLSVNIVLNILAASVIAFFQDTLAAVIALAVFLPIISDMSGCSGNQAVAVSMREITLGLIEPFDAFRVWLKEISVGLINGIVLGLLIAGVAWLWKGNPWLGLVVGGAMTINTMVAVSIGGVVPLALKKFGMDPALASGPILTTVTDMCGFFLVLGFATLMLPLL